MRNLYDNNTKNGLRLVLIQMLFVLGFVFTTQAQVRVPFNQRTSAFTPNKKLYNLKGDFTMIGNTNLTPQNYTPTTLNNNNTMLYVDVDGNANTLNSSSANLTFSTENGATPSCSNIVYAGLYWTGRAARDSDSNSPETFTVTKGSVTKNYNKRQVSLRGPGASGYTQFTAAANNIYYPSNRDAFIYTAYTEVTDYVRANGLGTYTVADIALKEGNGQGTGYSGGWGLIVIYENSLMKLRDITIFDGHAFVVSGNSTIFEIPVSGFNTVQAGPVGLRLGVMASEGDVTLTGDRLSIRNLNTNNFTDLSVSGVNAVDNFFNSAINTGGNTRNPNLLNNTGIDINMFTLPNSGNSIIGNNQTSTAFRYGTNGDTFAIFAIAMSVDAYIPEVTGVLTTTTINNQPAPSNPVALPGEEIGFSIDIRNTGTEAINNYKVVLPVPYNASYVAGSATGTLFYTTPNPTTITGSFDPSLGATGSIVWDFGTLPLPANASTLLARLTFKLTATTDCAILLNSTCGTPMFVSGSSQGTGANSTIAFNGTRLIKGFIQNNGCPSQPDPVTLQVGINGASFVADNCQNSPLIRNFSYCSSANTIGTSELAPNFPPGTTFFNQFPVTTSTIQYSDTNPLPLVAGSTITYYAVSPSIESCVFPFTVRKCPIIIARDDSFAPVNGFSGNTNLGNVFNSNGNGSDTLGGVQTNTSQVVLTVLTPATSINGNPVPSINPANGQISVPPGTPAGIYTITYQICENRNITNCDDAVVTIPVRAAIIDAVDDFLDPINGAIGNPNAGNVLTDNQSGPDTLNGQPVLLSQINLTIVTPATPLSNGAPVPSVDPVTGNISIPAGTPAGNYTVTYQICEILNPTNCNSAVVNIPVAPPAIIAEDDVIAGGNGTSGNPNAGNVLNDNGNGPDTLNGNPAASLATTTIDVTTPATSIGGAPVPNLDEATGQVAIPTGTPAGTYTIVYNLCEILNPTNCDPATVTITVTAPAIIAEDDAIAGGNGTSGNPNAGNVLNDNGNGSDTLNGNPATIATTTIDVTTPATSIGGAPVPNLDEATGQVAIPTGTPAGTYTIVYNLCEILNPTNCDPATVTITVTAPAIIAEDDAIAGGNGTSGNPNAGNVLNDNGNGSDTLNGNPATIATTTIDVTTPATSIGGAPVPSLDEATGQVAIPAGTPAGTYTIVYNLCEILNPTNCDPATVTITVTAPAIVAEDDFITIDCANLNIIGNVLSNDSLDNITGLTTNVVNYTLLTGSYPNLSIDNNGNIISSSIGGCGIYTFTYRICEKLNPSNCEDATVTITIQDTTAPTWTSTPGSLDQTIECSDVAGLAAAQALAPAATDNCDTNLAAPVKVAGNFVASSTCPNGGTITNTWTVTDACNNTSTVFTQVITIQDTTAPTWTSTPGSLDQTIECSDVAGLAAAQALAPAATDNCDTNLAAPVKVAGNFVASSTCPNGGTITNTWTVTDACNNTSTVFTQVITIQDTTAPTWTSTPGSLDQTIECSDVAGLAAAQALAPAATDNCDTNLAAPVKVAGNFVASSTCPNGGTITNTWTVTDACDNTSTVFTQVITIQDTTAPTWTSTPGSLDQTIECSDVAGLAAAQALAPAATDNCDTNLAAPVKVAGNFVASSTCPNGGTITNTWTVTDACNNTSTVFTQVITIQDTTAPTWTSTSGSLDQTFECSDVAGLAAAQALAPAATDNCTTNLAAPVKVAGNFVASSTCPNGGTITNTWTVTDACNNTSTVFTQVITIQDTTAPTWTSTPGSLDQTIECSDVAGLAAAQALAPAATDNCDTNLAAPVKVAGNFVASSTCPNGGTITNTWTVTDACNNTSTVFTQVITIQDTTAPTWTSTPGSLDQTIECSDVAGLAAAQALAPAATDNCDTNLAAPVKVAGNFVASSTCPNGGTITNTWTVTDACGNVSTVFTQVITIQDTTAPTWTSTPGSLDQTIECSDVAGLAAAQALAPAATDNCDTNLAAPVKVAGNFVASSTCPNGGTITNTWTVTDACDNTSTVFTQVITIQDTTAPTWTSTPGSLDQTIECSDVAGLAAAQALAPAAADNCDTNLVAPVKVAGNFVASSTCPNGGTITNTWTVTDACNNTSTVFTQVITIQDTTAPTWTSTPGSLDQTIECSDVAGLAAAQALAPAATDNCDTNLVAPVKVAGNFVASSTCPNGGTITNTWTVTDACDNTSTVFTQVITIQDTTAPTWTSTPGSLDQTIECSDVAGLAAAQALAPAATDNCDTNLAAPVKVAGNFVASSTCPNGGTITNTWTVTDACDNTSTVFTQVITIQDTTAPTWTSTPGSLDQTIECSDVAGLAAAQALAPAATDNCDTNLAAPVKVAGNFVASSTCPNGGTITNTWTVTDACDNTSTVFTQVITIQDTTAPTWTSTPGSLDQTIECSDVAGLAAAQALAPAATDNCDTNLAAPVKVAGNFVASSTCPNGGTITNTWTVTDACDNTSTVFTQVITIQDTTAPTWTSTPGSLDQTIECSDVAGLAAAQALAPAATDNCDTNLAAPVKVAGNFVASSTCPNGGTITNTWTVTDACNNTSTVFTQVITIQDTNAPEINVSASNLVHECGGNNNENSLQQWLNSNGGASATDNCSMNVVWTNNFNPIGNNCSSAVTVIFTATDACGNSNETSASFTIQDTTAPTWTSTLGSLDQTIECSDVAGLAAAQALAPAATDNCTTNLIAPVKVAGNFVASSTCPNGGTITNTWTVTDACDNTSTVFTQVITIQDTTAPTWTSTPGSLDQTIECSDVAGLAAAQALAPAATDNCDTNLAAPVKVAGNFVASSTCPNGGTITNTWTITDACGNVSTVFTQVITIQDTTAPTWTSTPGSLDQTIECRDVAGLAAAQALAPAATDNCTTNLIAPVKVAGNFVASSTCPNGGTVTNTWTVTDACNNTSTVFTQVITIQDTTAPTWTSTPGSLDQTIECSDVAGLATAQALAPAATDNCDTNLAAPVKVAGNFVASSTCPNGGTITNTWTVTDACDNTSTVFTQVITIQDTTAPTWTSTPGSLDQTIECSDVAGLAAAQALAPAATDNCDTNLVAPVKVAGNFVASSTCPNGGTITNTWTVTDACNNTSTVFTQVITIQDTTAPTWTSTPGSLDQTIECSDVAGLAAAQALAPAATDNCDTNLAAPVKVAGNFVASSTCPNGGTITNTWTVTDACDNTSTVFTQVITIQDTTAPTWTSTPGSLDQTIECSDVAGLATAQALAPAATDNCDTNLAAPVKVAGNFVASSTCPNGGTITNTWTVTDACNNTSTVFTQVITIQDTTAPTWTSTPGSLDQTIECSDVAGLAAAQALAPAATDNCTTNLIAPVKVAGNFVASSTCPNGGTITNTWTVTDACDNTSTVFTQVITIQDTTAPTWTSTPGSLDQTIECSDVAGLAAAQALAPAATDNCDTNLAAPVKLAGNFVASSTCPNGGTITNTWTVTDACDNTSTVFTQVITIQDTTAPTWTSTPGSLDQTIECSDVAGLAAAQALAPAATDNCTTNLIAPVKVAGNFVASSTCPNGGTITNTWTVTDACDNTSTVFTQVITIQDTTAPTWTSTPGSLDQTIECSDVAGLAAAQALAPAATDNCDTNLAAPVKVAGNFVASSTCPNGGTITNTWTVTDACDNTSTVFTQVITIQDTTAPTWTSTPGSLDQTIECSDVAGLAAAQTLAPAATDNCDTNLAVPVKVAGNFVASSTCPNGGTITNTWTVTDACDNTSTVFTQVITIQDTTAPTWTSTPGSLDQTIECSDVAGLAAAQALAPAATDNCDTNLAAPVKVAGNFVASSTCPNGGTITNTWTVTDACDNTSTVFTQVITIQDTTAPTWTSTPGSLDQTIECSDVAGLAAAQALAPAATDNCDTNLAAPVKVAGNFVASSTCPNGGTITNTWTVTDACNNTSTVFTQVITIQDTTAPTWTSTSGSLDQTFECSDVAGLAAAQTLAPAATDNCDTNLAAPVKVAGNFVASSTCPNGGTITNTWTITDACGNVSTVFTQVITIQDTTPPTLATPLTPKVDACSNNIPSPVNPDFTDNCDPNVSVALTEDQTPEVDGVYQLIRTWIATDACGNASGTVTQVINVTIINNVTVEVGTANEPICNDQVDFPYDLTTYLPGGTPAEGTWTNVGNVGTLNGSQFNAFGVASGTYNFNYDYGNSSEDCPQRIVLSLLVDDCGIVGPCNAVEIYNAVTANNDGTNDYFEIRNINDICRTGNRVEIYNRWGVLVYEINGYDNNDATRRFEGLSKGRATLNASDQLPTGTYFYIVSWTLDNGNTETRDGYLYLTR
jgi:hypothetical protein